MDADNEQAAGVADVVGAASAPYDDPEFRGRWREAQREEAEWLFGVRCQQAGVTVERAPYLTGGGYWRARVRRDGVSERWWLDDGRWRKS